jgi:hypothetical protein
VRAALPPRARPRTVPAAAASVAPSADLPGDRPGVACDPPYFFDARGNRVFKPECL